MKLFLRPAVVGLRPARAQVGPVNGRNHSPIEYSLQTVVRVPLFAIFSQPTLPRFLQFPHSSQCRLPSTSTFPMDRPQRPRHLIHSAGQRPRRPARQRHAVLPPSRGPRHKSISHPWCVLSTRLPAFPASAPAQLAWVPAWISRYASSNFRP